MLADKLTLNKLIDQLAQNPCDLSGIIETNFEKVYISIAHVDVDGSFYQEKLKGHHDDAVYNLRNNEIRIVIGRTPDRGYVHVELSGYESSTVSGLNLTDLLHKPFMITLQSRKKEEDKLGINSYLLQPLTGPFFAPESS